MKSTFKTAPLSALAMSPLNVRKVRDEDPIIAQVAASIAAKGLIQPIAVHALKKPKGALGVLAGQRRWRAIAKLEADGAKFDFANIPVVLFEGKDAELKEVSQTENVIREQMRPSEIYSGYREIKELDPSLTEADFAQRFGIEPGRMARIMRLALLHPTVFEAYDKGELKDEHAFAYAATDDQSLQLQVFESFKGKPAHQHMPGAIRRAMRVGEDELREYLCFVGIEAYQSAGGIYTADLFAQETNSGIVHNEEVLRRLVNEKLAIEKDAYTRLLDRGGKKYVTDGAWGLGDLKFEWAERPPTVKEYGYERTDYELLIRNPKRAPADQEGREFILLPKKGAVVGVAKIDRNGAFEVELYYASRKEKGIAEPTTGKTRGAGTVSKSPAELERARWGLTKDAMQAMLLLRRDMIRDQLVTTAESGVAFDFLLYSQARSILRPTGVTWDKRPVFSGHPQGIETPASQDESGGKAPSSVRKLYDTLRAGPNHHAAAERLAKEPWVIADDPVQGWAEFNSAGPEVRELAAAIIVGHSLLASTGFYADGRAPRMIQELANSLETAFGAQPWADTATFDTAFFELISHKGRLQLLDEWGLGDRAKTLKKPETAAFCARVIRAAREDEEDAAKLGIGSEDRGEIALWRPEWLDTATVGPLPTSSAGAAETSEKDEGDADVDGDREFDDGEDLEEAAE